MITRAVPWLRESWLDLCGVALTVLYALPSLWYPFARDHPVHWYIGQRLLEGELPYTSGISTKPPGVFVVHAAASLLFGDGMNAIRIVDLGFVLACGVMVATFGRRVSGAGGCFEHPARRPGEIGAACLAVATIHYTFFDFSDTAHPELWQGFFMLAPFWVLWRKQGGEPGWRRALGAGALAMVAVTFKHVAVVTGVLAGMLAVGSALRASGWRAAARAAAAYTAGVALVLGLTVLPFWVGGALEELWEVMVEFILRYAKQGVPKRPGPPPWMRYDKGLLAVVAAGGAWIAGLATAFALRNRRGLRTAGVVALVLAGTFGSVVIQKRGLYSATWTYYFVVTVPALALALAWGLRVVLSGRPWAGARQLLIVAALATGAFWYAPEGTHVEAWSYRAEWRSWLAYVQGRRSFREHHAPHRNSFLDDYVQLDDVASYIRSRARPGDTLCVDGTIMILYTLTDLRCPSRFLSGDGAGRTPEWQAEYRAALTHRPPTFFVTFGLRPRVRQLRLRGYQKRDFRYENDAWYTVLERPRDR